jgi:hypothetical protein
MPGRCPRLRRQLHLVPGLELKSGYGEYHRTPELCKLTGWFTGIIKKKNN